MRAAEAAQPALNVLGTASDIARGRYSVVSTGASSAYRSSLIPVGIFGAEWKTGAFSPVSFGTVTVSKQGVYDRHELYSWNYIVDVQPADNGILVTENSRGTPRTFKLPVTTPHDIHICMGLIRNRLK